MKSKSDNTVLTLSIVLAVLSALLLLFSIVPSFTGYATTDTATTQVELTAAVSIVFQPGFDLINFGSGSIDGGEVDAELDSQGTVLRGSWNPPVTQGFLLENDGTADAQVSLYGASDVEDWMSVPAPDRPSTAEYQFQVSNSEADSCVSGQEGTGFGSWADVGIGVGNAVTFCNDFEWEDGNDVVEIDVRLVVPDVAAKGASLSDIITVSASISPGGA